MPVPATMADDGAAALESATARFAAPIEDALAAHLPETSDLSPTLVEALRYAALGGGKRLRPAIVCATCVSLGGKLETALAPAAAIEYVHAYSLVHDDLPAMDDDDLRRGRPACHIAFDEATAILVGDGLQALAFGVLTDAPDIPAATRLRMVRLLAEAAGWRGMVGGQARDMAATGAAPLSLAELRDMHAAKTGALFRVSVQFGALCALPEPDEDVFRQLTTFGERLGVAFQIVDDVLDATQSSDLLGKPAGSDAAQGKNTYPALVGLRQARSLAQDTLAEALDMLDGLGLRDGPLAALAHAAVERVR